MITDLKIKLVLPRWDTNAFLDIHVTKHHVWAMDRLDVNLLMHFNDDIPNVADPAERAKLNQQRDTMVTRLWQRLARVIWRAWRGWRVADFET